MLNETVTHNLHHEKGKFLLICMVFSYLYKNFLIDNLILYIKGVTLPVKP